MTCRARRWAPSLARGAEKAASPADVASRAEIVLASLPMPDIVRAVALGENGVAHGKRARLFVDLSTTGPRMAKIIAAGLAERGITAIDAPVSGGIAGATKGTLAVMVSGPPADCERLKPLLQAIGKYFYIGAEPGMGQMMKLINNLLSATATAATSEAVVLGVKAGLDPYVMIDVINSGSGRTTASEDKFPKSILPRSFDFGFALGPHVEGCEPLHRRGGGAGRADVDRQRGEAAVALCPGARRARPGFHQSHHPSREMVPRHRRWRRERRTSSAAGASVRPANA